MGLSDLFIDPSDLPSGGYGFVQLLFLLVTYGYILFSASNLISDGSELLLLIPSLAGLVGSCVLPILGAVPDGAIVLFSGMGPDAQSQLAVGIGALAGSTIMLLTIPWFLSIVGGRVNIDAEGNPMYRKPKGAPSGWSKLNPPGYFSLFETGVFCSDIITKGGYIMLLTAISYIIIQGPALFLSGTDAEVAAGEKNWAIAGFIFCLVSFFGYLWYQWELSREGKDKVREMLVEQITKDKIMKGEVSLSAVMQQQITEFSHSTATEATKLTGTPFHAKLKVILQPFFQRYDLDSSGTIDKMEVVQLLRDLGEQSSEEEVESFFVNYDKDQNHEIDFNEFVNAIYDMMVTRGTTGSRANSRMPIVEGGGKVEDDEDDEEDEEEEEIPEDLLSLPPDQQRFHILLRACYMMAFGTFLVLLFSDPMVDVLSEVGTRIDVSPFYISFILAPLASNASELLASYNYALKKTSKTITISFAALEGAACMNNTFCTGIFMLLIFTQGLAWEFSAETVSILFVEIAMALFAMKPVHTVFDGFLILLLYPFSLLLVSWLESMGFD
jgi:Ca2+/Na+ antiporter